MIARTLMLYGALILTVLAGGLYWSSSFSKADPNELLVREVVSDFSANIHLLNLKDGNVQKAIEKSYGPYITRELLHHWQKNPALAPGKTPGSSWPDHIVVESVQKEQIDYRVEGELVFVSQQGAHATTTVGSTPVHLLVSKVNERWLIMTYQTP